MARILYLIIGENKPSTRKRVLDSLGYLRARGHEVKTAAAPKGLAGIFSMLAGLPAYDVVVIQKKLFGDATFSLMRLVNAGLIYDFDDAVMFHEVERREPMTGKFFRRFCRTAASCRGVIAGNRYLAELASAARGGEDGVLVLPTPVDTGAIRPRDYGSRENLVIGWMGTKGNLGNLELIKGPLSELFKRFPGASLRVVSDVRPELSGIPVEFRPWSAQSEAEELRAFDIGVMPLADDIWTRGKGGYKLLQYMAAGVACVASPVGINREIISDGVNGFLAADSGGWSSALGRLVSDPGLRESTGRAGRKTVEDEYSLERYNERLAGFIERFV